MSTGCHDAAEPGIPDSMSGKPQMSSTETAEYL